MYKTTEFYFPNFLAVVAFSKTLFDRKLWYNSAKRFPQTKQDQQLNHFHHKAAFYCPVGGRQYQTGEPNIKTYLLIENSFWNDSSAYREKIIKSIMG